MAKFCGNCGGQLNDDARVCGFCGTVLEVDDAVETNAPTYSYADPEKNEKIKKYAILGGIGAAAILVIVLVISFIVNNTGYNGAVNTVMGVFEDGADYEIEDILDMPSSKWDEDEFEKYYDEYFENQVDYFEDETDDDYDLSWEITKTTELKEKDVDTFAEYHAEAFEDFDEDILTEVIAVKVKMTAEADDDTQKEKIIIVLTKEDGDWKLYGIFGETYDLEDNVENWENYLDSEY